MLLFINTLFKKVLPIDVLKPVPWPSFFLLCKNYVATLLKGNFCRSLESPHQLKESLAFLKTTWKLIVVSTIGIFVLSVHLCCGAVLATKKSFIIHSWKINCVFSVLINHCPKKRPGVNTKLRFWWFCWDHSWTKLIMCMCRIEHTEHHWLSWGLLELGSGLKGSSGSIFFTLCLSWKRGRFMS